MIAAGSANRGGRQETMAERTLKHVERVVSDHLGTSASGSKFRVRLRLYAGWYSGRTHTPYRQGIIKVMNTYGSRTRSYLDGHVAFSGGHDGIQLGDRLACVPRRLARRHDVHLLDTLRQRDGTKDEKMVDTALAVDLLGLANRKEADRYVVVSDDDDMLPGLLAVEATGAKSTMLSRSDRSSRFMAHVHDLICTYRSITT